MRTEDSAVRKLDEIFAQEAEAQGISLEVKKNRTINATREQVDEIVRYYEIYPQHTSEFNIIVETGKSAESILNNMSAFMYPDGESVPELSEFDKKVLSFMNRDGIRHYLRENMGIRSVGVKDIQ
jgi:hypothetical protein